MRYLRGASLIIQFLAWVMVGGAAASFNGPPAITIFPDDPPVDVSFFFPAGGPLERFTGRPGAWYAIYRTSMYPGRPYDLILQHSGDPGRMKLFALDNHPFERVSVKSELPLRKIEVWLGSQASAYVSTVMLPRDASASGIYLLLEWAPPLGHDKPLPVTILMLSVDPRPQMRQVLTWWVPWADNGVKSPLHSLNRNAFEIPVPRWDPPNLGAREAERNRQ
jgi:hypothetical protein